MSLGTVTPREAFQGGEKIGDSKSPSRINWFWPRAAKENEVKNPTRKKYFRITNCHSMHQQFLSVRRLSADELELQVFIHDYGICYGRDLKTLPFRYR